METFISQGDSRDHWYSYSGDIINGIELQKIFE